MIPLIHQSLHILALGQRISAQDIPDARGFIAALAERDDSPSAPAAAISAEACLMGGMVVPALPTLTAPPMSPAQPTTLSPAEVSPSELAAAPNGPPTMPISSAVPLVLTPENPPQAAVFGAVEIPAVGASKPVLPVAADKFTHAITPSKRPRDAVPAEAIPRPFSDPASTPAATPQNSNSFTHKSIAAPSPIVASAIVPATALAPQIVAAKIIVPAQTAEQPTNKLASTSHPAMMPLSNHTEANTPRIQRFPLHALPNQTSEDQAAPQQIRPVHPQPAQTQPVQIPGDQTQDVPPPAAQEKHKRSISTAESAWQTRLQRAVPLRAHPKPTIPPIETMVDAACATADSPTSTTATVSPAPDRIGLKTFGPPSPLANPALSPKGADSSNPRATETDTPPAQQPAASTSAQLSSDTMPKPMPDAAAPSNPPAALPDQATLQPALDQLSQQTNPLSSQPPQQTAQTQAVPPSLATTVPAQLLHHTAAAKTGGVDVLLQPEELGHVKFQIQQHGETIRILLSAERPETLDLLRRHSDQLLQEFRQSGFSQASLNFGQWGQQQRSPAPPPELAALFDADRVDAPHTPQQSPIPATAPSGQGLNLRL